MLGQKPARGVIEATPLAADLAKLAADNGDIVLNAKAHWKNVPRPAWEYTLGGYQVLKK